MNVTVQAISSSNSSRHHNSKSSSTKQININITDGGSDDVLSNTVLERTTESNGTKKDTVTYANQKAKEIIAKLISKGKDITRIVATDKDTSVSETQVNIPKNTLATLSSGNINLEIETGGAIVSVPKESIQDLYNNEQLNGDLYFRLVPINDESKKEEIKRIASQEAVKKDGSMVTGWFKDTDGLWYFLCDGTHYGALGTMETGWKFINGNWYYFNSNGSMASNTTIDGYTLDTSGALV